MKHVYVFFFVVCFFRLSAQNIIISEISPSNISYIHDEETEESPDWIELKNISSHACNLSEYSIAIKNTIETPFQLPEITISPQEYVLLTYNEHAVSVAQWQTIIDKGDSWQYILPQAELPSEWKLPEFNASSWQTGNSGFGYGDNDDETIIPPTVSVFIRKIFTLDDISEIASAILHMDYDDGFVAYINGHEIARVGLVGKPPLFNEHASGNAANNYEANWFRGLPIEGFEIADIQNVLHVGENCIAIQVHNVNIESSDLTAIPILSFGYSVEQEFVKPVSNFITLPSAESSLLVFPFKLPAKGETLYLLKNGDIVDSIAYNNILPDVSIGRYDGNAFENFYFDVPTPGTKNSTQRFVAKTISKPIPSEMSKVFKTTFNLGFYSNESNAVIRYTIDGSEPTETSAIYTDSIEISKSVYVRARVFKNGYLPSAVTSISFIKHARARSIPIVSIAVKHDDFFDWNTGIYVEGPHAEKAEPHYGANYWEDWEKPSHVTIIEPDGSVDFSYNLGVKISGNWSRMHPQKSLKFYARSRYGDSKIAYQMFHDKPIYEFQSFILRNSGNDYLNTHMRDGMISTLVKNMGVARSAYRASIVYVNGSYFGIQNLREKPNKHYFKSNYGIEHENLCLFANSPWDMRAGSADTYVDLTNFIENNDLSLPENYERVQQDLDISNYIAYFVIEMFVVNEDWLGNNIFYWRENSPQGKWRLMLYDADFGFGIWDASKVYRNMLDFALKNDPSIDWPNPPWATLFFRKLTQNNDFNILLMNTLADRLNTTFLPDSIHYVIDSLAQKITPEFSAHNQKWLGSTANARTMTQNIEAMKAFGSQRGAIMRQHFEQHFNTAGSYKLSLTTSESTAGKIHINTIDITSFPWSGLYFKSVPITLTALPAPGYKFVRWEGDVTSTEPRIVLTRTSNVSVHAVFEYDETLMPHVYFTELQYNPIDSTAGGNWIELYNDSDVACDISDWILRGQFSHSSYVFPQNTVIPAYSYLVVCSDTVRFTQAYAHENILYVGNIPFPFSNKKDCIQLYDAASFEIDRIAYSDRSPWLQKADGYGYTLALNPGTVDRTDPLAWRSITYGGTLGAENAPIALTPSRNAIVINEINYKSQTYFNSGDWVELYNTSSRDVDVSNWIIRDNNDDNMSIIPTGTIIPAHGYLVLCDNPTYFSEIFPDVSYVTIPLSLGSYSDMVRLYDQYEFMIDSVHYSIFSPWPMLANGYGYTLALMYPELDNANPLNWAAGASHGSPGEANFPPIAIDEYVLTPEYVYPNPAREYVTLTYDEFEYVILYTNMGQQIYKTSDATISVAHLPRGTYLLKVYTTKSIHTHYIILH